MALLASFLLNNGIPGNPPVTRLVKSGGFSVSYGELEDLLAKLNQTSREQIRVRFRKLRLRPFPGDIRTGTGIPVEYDLPRALAIIVAFELNALLLPQGQAVDLVERSWPEVCRAALGASIVRDIIGRPARMPANGGPILLLLPNAFGRSDEAHVLAARACAPEETAPGLPAVLIDLRRVIDALAGCSGDTSAIAAALDELNATFGWSDVSFSRTAQRRSRDPSFLNRGPFLERAEVFLTTPDAFFDKESSPAEALRLQLLFEYLLEPSPIDADLALLGISDGAPWLGLLIAAFGSAKGLKAISHYPAVLLDIPEAKARSEGLSIIAEVRKKRG